MEFDHTAEDICCPICWGKIRKPTIMPCAHIYCLRCLRTALANRPNQCPLCQRNLTYVLEVVWPSQPTYVKRFDSAIRSYQAAKKPLYYLDRQKNVYNLIDRTWTAILNPQLLKRKTKDKGTAAAAHTRRPALHPHPQGKWKRFVEFYEDVGVLIAAIILYALFAVLSNLSMAFGNLVASLL